MKAFINSLHLCNYSNSNIYFTVLNKYMETKQNIYMKKVISQFVYLHIFI